MDRYLKLAIEMSSKGAKVRRAYLGAVGIRSDGTIVTSFNGCAENRKPEIHAERRLVAKLNSGSTVYVARIRRDDGSLAMAKPCKRCENAMRHRGVKKVIYSIGPNEYGTIEF